MFNIRKSILRRLFFGISLMLLAMMTATAFSIGFQAKSILEDKAKERLTASVQSSSSEVNSRVNKIISTLATFSSVYKHSKITNSSAYDVFTEMMEKNKDISELQIATPDGKYLTYPGSPTDGSYDPRKTDWYLGAMKQKEAFVSDVFQFSKTEFPKVAISLRLTDENEEPAGTVVAFMSVSQLSQLVEQMRIGDTGYLFIVDRQGKLLAHPDKKYALSRPPLDSMNVVSELIQGKSGMGYLTKDEILYFSAFQFNPILKWGFVVSQAESEVQKDVYRLQLMIATISLLGITVLAVLLYAFMKRITQPIKEVQQKMEDFRAGDLTQTMTVKTNDELHLLAESFNGMSGKIKEVMVKISAAIDQVKNIAQEVAEGSEQTCSMQYNVVSTTETLSQEMEKQNNQLADIYVIVEKISEEIDIITERIVTASRVNEETHSQTLTASRSIHLLQSNMRKVADDMTTSQGALTDLNKGMAEINGILSLIADISKKTKLLSFNARIEASRSGQAGMGFSVVADEIRVLSDHTEEATGKIQSVISLLGERMEMVSSRMTETNQTAVNGISILTDTMGVFTRIETMVEEMNQHFKEIERFSFSINRHSDEIQKGISYLSSSSLEVMTGTQQAVASTQESASISEKFLNKSSELITLVQDLKSEVNYFKE